MEIFIKNERVQFTQGVQTFKIEYEGDQKELEWVAQQLDVAFKGFAHEMKMEAISEYNERIIQEITKNK